MCNFDENQKIKNYEQNHFSSRIFSRFVNY